MQPVITQRPVALTPHYIPAQNATYQPTFTQRVAVRPPPTQQPTYIQNVPIHLPNHLPPQPVYLQPIQTVPIQGYVPQYQPLQLQSPQIAHQISPYFAQYIQPVPINPYRNLHPQMELNHNFDYEAANFLTDTTIVQNSVYCVICGYNFKASQKDQHLKKHMRKTDNSGILIDMPTKSVIESKVGSKKQYITKPLVQPQEHTIQYEPLVYEIVQEVLYQDKARTPMKDEAIGYQASFSIDQNVSFDQKNRYSIPDKLKPLKIQANPFSSKGSAQFPGNTLNEPVPFLNYNQNLQNSTNQPNGKLNQSILSELNKVSNPPKNEINTSKVSQGSQPQNYSLKVSQPKKT